MRTIQSTLVAFAMMFAMMVPVQADTDFQSFSQDDGMSALRAGDAMGLEVIPRKELEEVRGEGWVRVTIKVIDWLGRIEIVGRGLVWVAGNFKPKTCVYSGSYNANSTPSYCY